MKSEADVKREITTIPAKNGIINSIIREIVDKDSFLLVGHKNPDEDCIASLVAFALLLSKFSKKISVATCGKVQDQLSYLLNICAFNAIDILQECDAVPSGKPAVMVILDTPKPEMIDMNPVIQRIFDDPTVRKIEIDHHLEADARYSGDPGYRLVTDASSTCELIGLVALKISKRTEVLAQFGVHDVFSRNLALAILTGIIGDSKMGKFLKTNRERWFYKTFSSMFNAMLVSKTVEGSSNFSSMEQVFKAIQNLSKDEKACFDTVLAAKTSHPGLSCSVFDAGESSRIQEKFGNDIIVTVTKAAADTLAEDSGKLGLIAYYDPPGISDFIQFRLRRNKDFTLLDLRTVLEKFKIENGGGHPGAIGFRIEKSTVPDFRGKIDELVRGIESMLPPS